MLKLAKRQTINFDIRQNSSNFARPKI